MEALEPMDCDSDTVEAPPSKKPRIMVKIAPLIGQKERTTPSINTRKESKGRDQRFFKKRKNPDTEDIEDFKDIEGVEDKFTERIGVSKKTKKGTEDRLSRFLKMNEGNDMDVEDFEHEVDKENKGVVKYKRLRQARERSKTRFSRCLYENKENKLTQEDLEERHNKENKLATTGEVPQNSNNTDALLSPYLKVLGPNDVEEKTLKNEGKEQELIVKAEASQEAKNISKAHLSRFLKINEESAVSDDNLEYEVYEENDSSENSEELDSGQGSNDDVFMDECLTEKEKFGNKDISSNKNYVYDFAVPGCSKTPDTPPYYSRSTPLLDSSVVDSDSDEERRIIAEIENACNTGSDEDDTNSDSESDIQENDLAAGQQSSSDEDDTSSDSESDIQENDLAAGQQSSTAADDTDSDSYSEVKEFVLEAIRESKKLADETDSDSDSDPKEGSLAALRKENKARMKAIFNSIRDPELEKMLEDSSKSRKGKAPVPKGKGKAPKPKGKGKTKDSAFRFSGQIPLATRRSSRLQNKNPDYSPNCLNDFHETLRHTYLRRPNYSLNDHLPEDLEDIVYRPKRKSFGNKKKAEEHVIIPAEEVTQEMLDNIAVRVKGKVYSADGTTCHQCRQKTLDQKTCCRNRDCTGIFGMFCGICLKNRYGEDAAEALLNPNWTCPVCRGRCNCSICRTKQGKRPTGILAPLAQQSGYESVDHFLETLRGEGDRPEDDGTWKLKRDPEALLGFSDGGLTANCQDGSSQYMGCNLCAVKDCENPENLLGFSKDGGEVAIMGGYKKEFLFKPKNLSLSSA